MLTLSLDLGPKSYPIYIGNGLFHTNTLTELLHPHIRTKQVMIVSNTTVAPLYMDSVLQALEGFDIEQCILPDGEEYKTLETVQLIYTALLEAKFDRSATLIALGGGVVGDITGFAASSYQRGINFIGIPTTLLSQVDSSVGGKTGVNHVLGKNMIGAFHQPQAVIIDTHTLSTLDARQFSAGMAEVIKYGLILSPNLFSQLEEHIETIMNADTEHTKERNQLIEQLIYTSLKIKADIVAKDEFESGVRAVLNLGHTFGHAIENTLGYGTYLHGEAVAIGMIMAAELSQHIGDLSMGDVERIISLTQSAQLPVKLDAHITHEQFLSAMSVDKKARAGEIRLVLMKEIGSAYVSSSYDTEIFHNIIERYCTQSEA